MRKSRFSDELMVRILRDTDTRPVSEVAKQHEVSEQTLYSWRKRIDLLWVQARGNRLSVAR